jgi:hypothetical protein
MIKDVLKERIIVCKRIGNPPQFTVKCVLFSTNSK